MLKNTIFSSAIVLTAGLLATSAMAGGGEKGAMSGDTQGKHDVSFQKIDENGDGYISQSEFENANIPEVDHQMLDANQDGQVDETEFAAFEQLTDEQTGQQTQPGADYEQGSEWETEDPTQQQGEWEEDRDY